MANVNIEIQGMKGLQDRLKNARQAVLVEVGAELKEGANAMVGEAKLNARKGDTGFLWNEISSQEIDKLHYEVSSGAIYSPFMEFGTRSLVEIPAGLEEFAAQFQGLDTGSSLTAWEAIKQWCERKGIEKKMWWPIYMKVMRVGVKPKPFFFPALAKVTPDIVNRVKRVLEDI